MADLSEAIGSIMSDPDAMAQIKALGNMMGLTGEQPPQREETPPVGLAAPDNEMAGMMMKLVPLLGSLNEENDSTRLLYALRPFLSEKRRARVDQAARMLSLMRLLPMLKAVGIQS